MTVDIYIKLICAHGKVFFFILTLGSHSSRLPSARTAVFSYVKEYKITQENSHQGSLSLRRAPSDPNVLIFFDWVFVCELPEIHTFV